MMATPLMPYINPPPAGWTLCVDQYQTPFYYHPVTKQKLAVSFAAANNVMLTNKDLRWICDKCTFENNTTRNDCEMCNTMRTTHSKVIEVNAESSSIESFTHDLSDEDESSQEEKEDINPKEESLSSLPSPSENDSPEGYMQIKESDWNKLTTRNKELEEKQVTEKKRIRDLKRSWLESQQELAHVKEKYFLSVALFVKMNNINNGKQCNVDVYDLFDQARVQNIPLSTWPQWIQQQIDLLH
eukprot:TRINITY_DN10008_c0_g1_i1.p1 TRINITY_DN10008_c0_g1~~TRINITY_DN10008_c0_g1_i1.p1  ORF type:complete len:242 (-),score=53.72 TRINITY_DN10008_c0_g1_i1:74-799(-)